MASQVWTLEFQKFKYAHHEIMNNMVYGLPQIKEPSHVCEECYKAKQAKKSFKHELPIDAVTVHECGK